MSFRYGYDLDIEGSDELQLRRKKSPNSKLVENNYSIPMIFNSKMITIKLEPYGNKLKIDVFTVVLVEKVRIAQLHRLKVR
jgi:hypothetical protein